VHPYDRECYNLKLQRDLYAISFWCPDDNWNLWRQYDSRNKPGTIRLGRRTPDHIDRCQLQSWFRTCERAFDMHCYRHRY